MPINYRNLGKYVVPGIYIEEVDDSPLELPIQEVLINLVPGFSKKGPFNRPVKVNTTQDFEAIFGSLDKGLENKGSYFHRTVLTMLDQGPVWALNLLRTDPTRDRLQWKSISVSAQYDNGSLLTAPYERFFNRQDFWVRDDESFNDIVVENNSGVEDDDRLLHITNMSDRTITVFMFKSSVTGFDVTAEQWYGGRDKVPLFMNAKDWISDYMVSVLVVYGDWTDYNQLSSDSTWSSYFTVNGLIKTKVSDFANHVLVTRLAYYDASLIPGFKDQTGLDMYVKNVINNDTDKTGLFCTYNENILLSADYPMGKIDLLGQTLVGTDKSTIEFLSYQESISESLTYSATTLDAVGNVFGNYPGDMTTALLSGRTAGWTNWYTEGIATTGSSTERLDVISCDGSGITLSAFTELVVDDVVYFTKNWSIIDRTRAYYIRTIVGNTITLSTTKGGTVISGISTTVPSDLFVYKIAYKFDNEGGSGFYNLGSYRYYLTGETSAYLSPLTISTTSAVYSRYDVLYLTSDNTKINTVTGSQVIGTSPTLPNYIVNNTSSLILGYTKTVYSGSTITITYTGVTTDAGGYVDLDSSYITSSTGETSTSVKYLDIVFENTYGSSSDWTNYSKLRSLKIYSELYTKLSLGKGVIINTVTGYKYQIPTPSFYDANLTENARIRVYVGTEDPNQFISGTNFIFYYIDNEFVVGNGLVPYNGITTSNAPVTTTTGIVAKYSTIYQAYVNGMINNYDYIWMNNDTGTTQKLYIKMMLDSSDNLTLGFLLEDKTTTTSISGFDTNYLSEFIIYSDKSNWKQTVEIENPTSITDLTNTTMIYVNKTRYSELKRGVFLEAYYDTSYYDSPGEGYMNGEMPRKFVRIVNVVNDTVNTNLKILYADGPIKIYDHWEFLSGSTVDYSTTSYYSIDNYVDEYKGVAIDPFTVHADSIPNGTDARQSDILTVINKGTRLSDGLINKNRITWRYLVDSFGLGLTSDSKQQYLDLCGEKLNSLGFINMPSARQFKKSSNPSFINDDYSLNMEYIKMGGDDTKNPDFYYTFGEGVGQSTVSYWFPYIKTDDESSKFIPPAAEIAKTFMKKFTTINPGIKPWTILGGIILGALPNVKETEIRFTQDDLKSLNEMNANAIDYIENYGYIINSDNTAQVYPYSSLSLIHSREVLIELENRLYDMLLNYHWRFNTPEIRAEIKYRADQICKELKESDALYAYRNVCDKTNNTDYIIDNQMGVLDTYVEIIKGMGIIVNQITILKKGTLESTGFRTT